MPTLRSGKKVTLLRRRVVSSCSPLSSKKAPLSKRARKRTSNINREESSRGLAVSERSFRSPTVQSYGDVLISGSSSVVVGNVYVNIGTATRKTPPPIPCLASFAVSPLDLLERCPCFPADAYTQDSQEVLLFNYSGDEVTKDKVSQSFLFNMLFRPDAHSLVHISLSLEVSVQSKYWGMILPDSKIGLTNSSMPADLLSEIKHWLSRNKASTHAAYLKGFLTDNLQLDLIDRGPHEAFKLQSSFRSQLSACSDVFHHWQCQWFDESRLRRRLMGPSIYRSHFSWVYIPGKKLWAREVRFRPGSVLFESQIHTIRILHCLQLSHCPGIPHFFGIVHDYRGCAVAFLTDMPAKGPLAEIMRQANHVGKPVDAARREKWCYQLLNLVATAHLHTFVLGVFGQRLWAILGVDCDDYVVLTSLFRPILIDAHSLHGSIPPEHRDASGHVRMTPQIDMFQLGLVLWQIAGNNVGDGPADFCRSSGCKIDLSMLFSEPHADPVALEMSSTDYSEYMRRIIDNCRSRAACDRKPAAELLKWFPGSTHSWQKIADSDASVEMSIEDCRNTYGCDVGCSNCGGECTTHFFHCNICDNDDFDICKDCFDKDMHCYNDSHLLYEYKADNEMAKGYSSVKESGQREVSTL